MRFNFFSNIHVPSNKQKYHDSRLNLKFRISTTKKFFGLIYMFSGSGIHGLTKGLIVTWAFGAFIEGFRLIWYPEG